jgi:hypothetical protein
MSSIATIIGLTSYNPYKEAITILVGGTGPYLINHLTFKPESISSKIDQIRETLFGIRTRFLELTQKNALTKYTWLFLKYIPTSLALSKVSSFTVYLIVRMEEPNISKNALIHINCWKHLFFLIILSVYIYDELNPSPPKQRSFNNGRELIGSWEDSPSDQRAAYFVPLRNDRQTTLNYSERAWKASRRTSETNLGKKSPLAPSNPGGFKAV